MRFVGLVSAAGLLLGVACSGSAKQADKSPLSQQSGYFTPPPKPGHSIASSKLCRCRSCSPAKCCVGPEDQPAPECDSYDFSECAVKIQSCESRCIEHRWRVPLEKSCESTRPEQCC